MTTDQVTAPDITPTPSKHHHLIPEQRTKTTRVGTAAGPRVWLVAGLGARPEPTDHPTVRDDLMRHWEFGEDGRYHSTDGWHHATWAELHARFDLIEVTR